MRRLSIALLAIALTGWTVAGIAHVRGLSADGTDQRSTWEMRRNRWLLLSSISMNSLVLISLYRVVKKLMYRRR